MIKAPGPQETPGKKEAAQPIPDSGLNLSGDRVALIAKYLSELTNVSDYASPFARQHVVPFMDHVHVNDRKSEGYDVTLYSQAMFGTYNATKGELQNTAEGLMQVTGKKIAYRLQMGKPPEGTEETWKNKIRLLKEIK